MIERRLQSIVNELTQNQALDNARRGSLRVPGATPRFLPGTRVAQVQPVPASVLTDAEVTTFTNGTVTIERGTDTARGWHYNAVSLSGAALWNAVYAGVTTQTQPEVALRVMRESGDGPLKLGFFDVAPTSLAVDGVWLEASNTWVAHTVASGNETTVDTLVPVRTDRPQELYVVVVAPNLVRVFIDGFRAAQIPTTIPETTTSLLPQVSAEDDSGDSVWRVGTVIGLSNLEL